MFISSGPCQKKRVCMCVSGWGWCVYVHVKKSVSLSLVIQLIVVSMVTRLQARQSRILILAGEEVLF